MDKKKLAEGLRRLAGDLAAIAAALEKNEEEAPEQADEEAALEQAYLREERKIALHRAMRSLKPTYRQALWLVYFEDMPYKEAAAVMGKTVHATEALTGRARAALKKELEKEGITHEDL